MMLPASGEARDIGKSLAIEREFWVALPAAAQRGEVPPVVDDGSETVGASWHDCMNIGVGSMT
jgi:hypothetical protein